MCTHAYVLLCIVFVVYSYAQRDSPTYEPYESNERLVACGVHFTIVLFLSQYMWIMCGSFKI